LAAVRWIVIRRRSADRLACAFATESAARAAMARWHAEGWSMELVRPGSPRQGRVERLDSMGGEPERLDRLGA
jgi:hypothetical protein